MENMAKMKIPIVENSKGYNNKIETNGTHFYIKVKSPELENFRKYLGLSPKLKYDFHITVARTI